MAWPQKLKGSPKQNAEKTHCKWGHEFTEQNTIWKDAPTASGKMRVCRKCKADRDKTRRRVPRPSNRQALKTMQEDLLSATVSCSGLEITIQCNDHDVKDRLMDFLTGGRGQQAGKWNEPSGQQ